jgi:hypothetical protein
MHYDVFNGDADGIIALLQLRLNQPKKSTLITGVKRDISLLERVPLTQTESVTVLDISMEKNAQALDGLLANRIPVFYVDHHRSGAIPQSEYLTELINTDPNICTSLLVNRYLDGQFAHWAIVAAFGDNMNTAAEQLAKICGLSVTQQQKLKALGIYINYNGYGRSIDDLHFSPIELYNQLLDYPEPLTLINQTGSVYQQLEQGYLADMAQAKSAEVLADNDVCKVLLLPDQAWARRVSGVFGNELANQAPDKAHAVFTENQDSSFLVSLRAPLNNKQGAGDICSQFITGGGRAAAAGINALPKDMVEHFIATVSDYYQ